ncbi:MAG: rhomboid family intramembrane serine protease [Cyclobacteriaceae bacterium]
MWLTYTVDTYVSYDLSILGILPRTIYGLVGIFTAPLVHGDVGHLMSNTLPLLVLGGTLFYFYTRFAYLVFFEAYFFTNILVWLFGRPHYHIGASGLVYGLASFLIFYGLFKRDALSIVISSLVVLGYGGMVYGLLPMNDWISWESHLMGAIVGLGSAIKFGIIQKRKF